MAELLDGIGPRLTGSPNLEKAIAWALDRLRRAGSMNARKESWGEFGMGWRSRNVWVRLVEPDTANVIAEAAPWSPATAGPLSGEVVRVRGFTEEAGFAPLRGNLKGKIVLLGRAPSAPDVVPIDKPLFERLSDERLAEIARQPLEAPGADEAMWQRAFADAEFYERVSRFFADEGVRAVLAPSGNNPHGGVSGGTLYSDWNYSLGMYGHQKSRAMRVPTLVISVAYNRLARLLERKVPVSVEVNVDVEVTGDRVEGFNVLAEIPGTDARRSRELVMVSPHAALCSGPAGLSHRDAAHHQRHLRSS